MMNRKHSNEKYKKAVSIYLYSLWALNMNDNNSLQAAENFTGIPRGTFKNVAHQLRDRGNEDIVRTRKSYTRSCNETKKRRLRNE